MSTFKRTDKQNDRNLRGQAELVMLAIESFAVPVTIEQLTPIVVDAGLKTKQDPARIVSYYLSIFKKQGLVEVVKPEIKAPEPEPTAAEAEVTNLEAIAALIEA